VTNDPAVLIVKKGDIAPATRDALRRIGIYVVESVDPVSVRFLKANAALDVVALKALHASYVPDSAKALFTAEVWRMVRERYQRENPLAPAKGEWVMNDILNRATFVEAIAGIEDGRVSVGPVLDHDAALRERVTKLDAALREIRSCAFSHATRAYYEVQIDRMLWDVTLPALLAPEAEGKEGE